MNCPSREQILKAAGTNKTAYLILESLYPEIFEKPIQSGEIYDWGGVVKGGSGVVVDFGEYFHFINFRTGLVYLQNISKRTTKNDLNNLLGELPGKFLHDCYSGSIKGPKKLTSWCTK